MFAAVTGAIYFDEALDIQDYIGIMLLVASIIMISKQSKAGNTDPGSTE